MSCLVSKHLVPAPCPHIVVECHVGFVKSPNCVTLAFMVHMTRTRSDMHAWWAGLGLVQYNMAHPFDLALCVVPIQPRAQPDLLSIISSTCDAMGCSFAWPMFPSFGSLYKCLFISRYKPHCIRKEDPRKMNWMAHFSFSFLPF